MAAENMEPVSSAKTPTEGAGQSDAGVEMPTVAKTRLRDASALVARMVEAGEWPEPDLMEQIAAAGDAAVEPLLAILRSKPRGWPAEAPLNHAVALLVSLRPPAAVPELIEIVKDYANESGEDAAEAVASYGEAVFEPLLELAGDPALRGYRQGHAITAARRAAGSNPVLRTRLADLLHPMLANAIERARRERHEATAGLDSGEVDEVDSNEEFADESLDKVSGEDLAGSLAEIETSVGRPDCEKKPGVFP